LLSGLALIAQAARVDNALLKAPLMACPSDKTVIGGVNACGKIWKIGSGEVTLGGDGKLSVDIQFVEQSLGLLQIERIEPFGEPAVDRCEKLAGVIPLALIAPEARHAHRCAQLPGLCLLLVRVFRLGALSPHTDV
jgi:hypothetical protein